MRRTHLQRPLDIGNVSFTFVLCQQTKADEPNMTKAPTDYISRTDVLSYRVPKELRAELQKLADADKRKLASYIQLVLADHVEKAKSGKRK